jgi:hypothetical protein
VCGPRDHAFGLGPLLALKMLTRALLLSHTIDLSSNRILRAKVMIALCNRGLSVMRPQEELHVHKNYMYESFRIAARILLTLSLS